MATPGSGGGGSALGAGAFAVVRGGSEYTGSHRLIGGVVASGTFRLDVEITPDDGATWMPYKQITGASSGESVSYGGQNYTHLAEIDLYCPAEIRVRIKNTSGGNIDWQSDVRSFHVPAT